MASRPKLTAKETLELYRVALENAVAQSEIATKMAELGYDSKVIGEGKALLEETLGAFNKQKTEDDESYAALLNFSGKRDQLKDVYTIHRKLAKVVFRKDFSAAMKLAIPGIMPRTYIEWLETVKTFYRVASTDIAIQDKFARLRVSPDEFSAANSLISELESARAVYLKEKAESENSTQMKNAAFVRMDHWMSDFYMVARIGLKDNPQLLEVFGKTVKR